MKQIEKRALELFAKGKFQMEVREILLEEFANVNDFEIEIEVLSAWNLHNEKQIPDENYTNQ